MLSMKAISRLMRRLVGVGTQCGTKRERRLHQAPLPQPEIAFAREQSFAKNVPVRPQNAAFDVAARMADQNFLDEVGAIDKNIAKIDHADADDIPVARQFAKHLQRALTQRAERPAFEPSVGA